MEHLLFHMQSSVKRVAHNNVVMYAHTHTHAALWKAHENLISPRVPLPSLTPAALCPSQLCQRLMGIKER